MNRRGWMTLALVLAVVTAAIWWVASLEDISADALAEEEPATDDSPQAIDEPTNGRRRIRLERPELSAVRRGELPSVGPDLRGQIEGVPGTMASLEQVQARVAAQLSEQCVGAAWEEAIRTSGSVDFLVAGETEVQVEVGRSGVVDVFLLDNGGSSDVLLSCYADQVWSEQWPSLDESVVVSLGVRMLIEVEMEEGTVLFPSAMDGDEEL